MPGAARHDAQRRDALQTGVCGEQLALAGWRSPKHFLNLYG
jgi:hypothetical protein